VATGGQVWITRAQPGADATAARVAALGYQPLVAPVLVLRTLDTVVDLEDADVLAFTSGNGVRAFAGLSPRRDRPAFCVGRATAEAARAAGLEAISADGDAQALAERLVAALPRGARVLHPCATELAGDLDGPLAAAGLRLRHLPVYESVAVERLPEGATQSSAVLIHSPRAARTVAALLAARTDGTGLRVLAISEAAATPLRDSMTDIRVAACPDETSLLARLVA
jgi:uroporphyrinogen-III synthase